MCLLVILDKTRDQVTGYSGYLDTSRPNDSTTTLSTNVYTKGKAKGCIVGGDVEGGSHSLPNVHSTPIDSLPLSLIVLHHIEC